MPAIQFGALTDSMVSWLRSGLRNSALAVRGNRANAAASSRRRMVRAPETKTPGCASPASCRSRDGDWLFGRRYGRLGNVAAAAGRAGQVSPRRPFEQEL